MTTLHSALYQQAESAFRGGRNAGGGGVAAAAPASGSEGAAPAAATPVLDQTLDYLGKNYGLHTPEWAFWRAQLNRALGELDTPLGAERPGVASFVVRQHPVVEEC